MGMMTGLRRFAKRQRTLGIIFVIVLSVGLIGSYAFFGNSNEPIIPTGQGQGQDQEAADSEAQREAMEKALEEQITWLESEITSLQKELEAKPDDLAIALQLGDSHYLLGETYYVKGEADKVSTNFDEALALFQQVLEQDPQQEGIYVRLAGAALYTGDMDLAETYYQEALAVDPDDNYVRLSYGYMLAMKGAMQEAIEQWQEISEHNPTEDVTDQANMLIEQAREAMAAQQEPESGNNEQGPTAPPAGPETGE